jgi:hypothetical protein
MQAPTFAYMPLFRIPKSVLWVLLNCIVLLAVMMAYRVVTQSIFSKDIEQVPAAKIWWMGFRFDFRYVSIVALLVLLIGFLPALHLYKSIAGKRIGIVLFTLFAFIMLMVFGLDFAHQITFSTRIEASIFSDIISHTGKATTIYSSAPMVIILLLIGVGTWLMYLIFRFIHHRVGKTKASDNKAMRIFWQTSVLLLLLFGLYGRLGTTPLSYKIALQLGNEAAANVAINAFEAVGHTAGK